MDIMYILTFLPCKYYTVNYVFLHSHQHTGILVPAQQRVLPIPSLCILDISPPAHEVFMAHDLGQFSSHGTIHVFNDIEVSWEEDIEVPLVNLYSILALLIVSRSWHLQMVLSPVPSVSGTVSGQLEHSIQAPHLARN